MAVNDGVVERNTCFSPPQWGDILLRKKLSRWLKDATTEHFAAINRHTKVCVVCGGQCCRCCSHTEVQIVHRQKLSLGYTPT